MRHEIPTFRKSEAKIRYGMIVIEKKYEKSNGTKRNQKKLVEKNINNF